MIWKIEVPKTYKMSKLLAQEEAEIQSEVWGGLLQKRLDKIVSCTKTKCRIWRSYELVCFLASNNKIQEAQAHFQSAVDSLKELSESEDAADRGRCAALAKLLSQVAMTHGLGLNAEEEDVLESLAQAEDNEQDTCFLAWLTYYLGKDHIFSGRAQKAIDCFTACLAFFPEEPKFLYKLGWSLSVLTEGYLYATPLQKVPESFEKELNRQTECLEQVYAMTGSQKAAATLAFTCRTRAMLLWHVHEGRSSVEHKLEVSSHFEPSIRAWRTTCAAELIKKARLHLNIFPATYAVQSIFLFPHARPAGGIFFSDHVRIFKRDSAELYHDEVLCFYCSSKVSLIN